MTVRTPWEIAADIVDPPDWQPEGRPPPLPHQVPPPGAGVLWRLWLLVGGRGSGKTETCSRYFAKYMRQHPGTRARIIAPTFGDAVESCIEGPSGLKAIDPDGVRWLPSAPGGAKVSWDNGSEALVIGTPTAREVDRLRAAGNRELDWWEEMAANPMLKEAWDQAAFGLRIGNHHSIASTTPRTKPKLRELIRQESTAVSRATMRDNPHLSEEFKQEMERQYAGTRLGRQELMGELLEDVEGALWTLALLDLCRTNDYPDLVRIVVGVDPSGGAGEQGIVVAGISTGGTVFVLDDRSCCLSPRGWASRAVQAYHDYGADAIVAEKNYGGDMVKATIQGVDPMVKVKEVTASRGKAVRAEPVANLYGDPGNLDQSKTRVFHVGDPSKFAQLEDQLTTWTPFEGWSPDRLDALVWAITDLALGGVVILPVDPGNHRQDSYWRSG